MVYINKDLQNTLLKSHEQHSIKYKMTSVSLELLIYKTQYWTVMINIQ